MVQASTAGSIADPKLPDVQVALVFTFRGCLLQGSEGSWFTHDHVLWMGQTSTPKLNPEGQDLGSLLRGPIRPYNDLGRDPHHATGCVGFQQESCLHQELRVLSHVTPTGLKVSSLTCGFRMKAWDIGG